jgi:hypothetical protein
MGEAVVAEGDETFAERCAKSPVSDEATYQRKLEETRSYLRPNMRVCRRWLWLVAVLRPIRCGRSAGISYASLCIVRLLVASGASVTY